MAVTEAIANAVVHAYPGGRGEVVVRACVDEEAVRVEVSDAGRGSVRDDPTAGLGLGTPLVRSFADEIEVEFSPTGTRVVLTFHLRARRAAERLATPD